MVKKETLIGLVIIGILATVAYAGNRTSNLGLNRWVTGDIDYVQQQNDDADTLDSILTSVGVSTDTFKTTFDKISRRIDFKENSYSYESFSKSTSSWRKWYGVAAVFIFLITAVSILYLNFSHGKKEKN